MSFTRPFLLGTVFFRTALPCSGGYHMERGEMPLHDAVGINCKKGTRTTTENQGSGISIWAKGWILMTVCVLSDLTWLPLLGGGRKSWYIFLLLRPAEQANVGKTKLFINCFCNPASTCATKNCTKHNSGKQPRVDYTHEHIQRSGIKHSVGKVIPHSNLGQQETPCKLGRSTPRYFKLQWMSCGRSSDMSKSSKSRRTLAGQTVIHIRINFEQHPQPHNTTLMTQWHKTLIRAKPVTEYTWR